MTTEEKTRLEWQNIVDESGIQFDQELTRLKEKIGKHANRPLVLLSIYAGGFVFGYLLSQAVKDVRR